ncbi:MAG: TonB-dependent receptor [Candidatus Amulumruptor caecigallinarius]|nr:MAG: TonB-dependent receptor [Candidatus Amulumruptor caecigallinarius]
MAADSKSAPKDSASVKVDDETKATTLLNASSASEPRAVPIGLPTAYTVVRQDGLPVTYFWDPNATNLHWRQDGSLASTRTLPMSQTAIFEGEVGVGVDSYTRLGQKELKGYAKYQLNTLGKHDFTLGVNGSLGKNTTFSLNAYNDMDPGNVPLQFTHFADRAQFYTGTLTHQYNPDGSKFSVFYRYTDVQQLSNTIKQAPFYWVGDGSIKGYENFVIGKDNYGNNDGVITYMDVRTGEMVTNNYNDMGKNHTHEVKLMWDHKLDPRTALYVRAKASFTDRANVGDNTQNVLESQTREYYDGSGEYTGPVQRRLVQIADGNINDYMVTVRLNKKTDRHDWNFAVFDYLENTDFATSSVQYDHEVKANPLRLRFNGSQFFNYNANAQIANGHENKVGFFVFDTWRIHPYVKVAYGGRLEYFDLGVNYSKDARYAGFYIGGSDKQGTGINQLTHENLRGFNYAVSVLPTINFTKDFGFDGEFNYLTMYRHIQGFYGANAPLSKERPHTLARAGLFYNHPYFNIVTSFTYSFRKGDSGRIAVTNDQGLTETTPYRQSIRTMGWKTDFMLNPVKEFSLNLTFTLQNPKLAMYKFEAFG